MIVAEEKGAGSQFMMGQDMLLTSQTTVSMGVGKGKSARWIPKPAYFTTGDPDSKIIR